MARIPIEAKAEVDAAVRDLGKVNAALTEQERTANKLERANLELDAAVEKLRRSYLELNANTDPSKQEKLERAFLDNKIAAGDAQEGVDRLSKELDGLSDKTGKASMSVTDFKSSVDLAGQYLQTLKGALDATAGKAASWGDDMGDLAQVTGQTVEATSEMAATLELLGIKSDNLGTVIKTMTKSGLQLNLATLKQLSKEYQELKDPVAQNEFLFKKFGKAGLDMAEVLGKSTEELERFAIAARRSGKVVSEEAANAAEEYNVQMAILTQRVEGAQIAIGNKLIPVLNDSMQGFDNLVNFLMASQIQLELNAGSITREEAAMRAAALAGADLNAVVEDVEQTQMAANAAHRDAAIAADSARWAAQALAIEQERNKIAADALAFGMRELTTQTLFNEAAAGLDSQAALELARSMGLVSEDAIRTQAALENLKQKYDTNRDGTVSATEATRGYIDAVRVLQNNIERLQDRTVTVTTQFITVGNPSTDIGELRNNGRAAGGPVTGGQPYIVGERGPELFVPGQGGMIVPNSQLNQYLGGVSISVSGAGDPSAVATEIDKRLRRLAAEARNVYQSGAYNQGAR